MYQSLTLSRHLVENAPLINDDHLQGQRLRVGSTYTRTTWYWVKNKKQFILFSKNGLVTIYLPSNLTDSDPKSYRRPYNHL